MTTDWTAGYVADIGYTFGYYKELNPLRARLALLNSGLTPPVIQTACELGFGQGLSTNIHAAASTVQWYGTDFNPSQAAFAQDLAASSGAGAKLYDDSFAEFAARSDMPDFDYIGLHGIWSWVSDANRAVIVDFIRRKLKTGGVLYISYNTQPGWASFAPMRHLMTRHGETMGSEGRGIVGRIDDAINFAERLLKVDARFGVANPQVSERLDKLKQQDRHYLAHEFFNRDWHPMHFSSMAEWLEPAKLTYACSAHFPELMDRINLTPDQLAFLQEVSDPVFKESVRDFLINQQFRRDYWIKGPRSASTVTVFEGLRALRVQLVQPPAKVNHSFSTAMGEVKLAAEVQGPVIELLSDFKPRSLGQIADSFSGNTNVKFSHLMEAVILLSEAGAITLVQDDETIAKARKQTKAFNADVMNRARGSADIAFLASPVTGGGVAVARFHQLFLHAMSQGAKTPREMAEAAWGPVALMGQKLVKGGVTLESAEENIAELISEAEGFVTGTLPLVKALGIA